MWCGKKFVYGHQCVRSQLYQLLVDEEDDGLIGIEHGTSFEDMGNVRVTNESEDALKPVISLHALLGTGDS